MADVQTMTTPFTLTSQSVFYILGQHASGMDKASSTQLCIVPVSHKQTLAEVLNLGHFVENKLSGGPKCRGRARTKRRPV